MCIEGLPEKVFTDNFKTEKTRKVDNFEAPLPPSHKVRIGNVFK
jgi:hypothetical protein